MVSKSEIESLGYIHIGFGWFRNVDDSYRIRKWIANDIDIWHWSYDADLCETVFRGRLSTLDELMWVLDRVTESNLI